MTSDLFYLATSLKIFNKKKKLIYLGVTEDLQGNEIKKNYKKIVSPWISFRKRKKDFLLITKFYKILLSALRHKLNKIHRTNYSLKYWEQLIGIWLIEYLISVYEKYLIVKKLENKKNLIICSPKKKILFLPRNSREAKLFFISDEWNHFLYVNLIKEFKKNIIIKKINFSITNKIQMIKKNRKFDIKNLIKKLIIKLLNIFRSNEKIFFINTQLPFFSELVLQFKLNRILKINVPYDNEYVYKSNFDLEKREFKLKSNKKDIEFIKYIKKNIFKDIPLVFLEEYHEIKKNYKFKKNKNLKKIFTASSNFYDDVFKIWLADQKEKGVKLIVCQHGAQFITKYCSYDFYTKRTCDYFFSWGDKLNENKKFITFTNIKTISKKVKITNKKNIIIFQEMPTKYNIRLWPGLHFFNYQDYLNLQDTFLQNLNKDLYEKIIVRLGSNPYKYSVNNYIQFEKNTWTSSHPKLNYEYRNNLEYKNNEIYSSLENSYLRILTTVNATLLFECISLNIPFLILTLEYKNILSKKNYNCFKKLEKNKILFKNPEELSNFVNSNSQDQILKWWYSKKNQKIIKLFQKDFSMNAKRPFEKLKKMLNSVK